MPCISWLPRATTTASRDAYKTLYCYGVFISLGETQPRQIKFRRNLSPRDLDSNPRRLNTLTGKSLILSTIQLRQFSTYALAIVIIHTFFLCYLSLNVIIVNGACFLGFL